MKLPVFLYKKRLNKKLGEGNFESTEECYHHLVKCIHQAAKEALGEKILRSKTKPFYYWNEEIGQLVKEKKKNTWNGLVQKTHRPG